MAAAVQHDVVLRELSPLRQPDSHRRRWFASPRCDLIVWLREDDALEGFQFCYDKDDREHALTWFADKGFSHMRVVTGGVTLSHGRGTPLLVANGSFDARRILELFHAESAFVPSDLADAVAARLGELACSTPRYDGH